MIVLDTNVVSELMALRPSAAVCAVHDAILVTRNIHDFEGPGIRLVDPWAGA